MAKQLVKTTITKTSEFIDENAKAIEPDDEMDDLADDDVGDGDEGEAEPEKQPRRKR